MSLSEARRSLGYIPDEVTAELKKDMEQARGAGLLLSCDGASDRATAPVLPPSVDSDADNDNQ